MNVMYRYYSRLYLFLCFIFFLLPAFATKVSGSNQMMSPQRASLHVSWLDKQVSPSQNFYFYANGTFIKKHPVSKENPSWSMWELANRKNMEILLHTVQALLKKKNVKEGSTEQKVRDFYVSGMDVNTMNKAGITPLKEELSRINNIKNQFELQTTIAQLRLINVEALFDFGRTTDLKNDHLIMADASAGGITMPSAEYYTENTKEFKKIRANYAKHIATIFRLMGDNPMIAAREADAVMRVETALAIASRTSLQQNDPKARYHPMTMAELNKLTPLFSWQQYVSDIKHPEITRINIEDPAFFHAMNKLLIAIPLHDWKTYLRWRLVYTYAPYLSANFREENLQLQTLLTGYRAKLSRAQQVIVDENYALTSALGELYIEKTFTPKVKKEILMMVYHIRDALTNELIHSPWMSKQTKAAALKKLNHMKFNIGYPEKGLDLDYSALKIDQGIYAKNLLRVTKFLVSKSFNKIGKPIDNREWILSPQIANAAYSDQYNTLYIAAGVLQPPFYDFNALRSVNYGALGSTIGHEMTHAFDEMGAQYDSEGILNNWWTPADLKKFHAAMQCLSNQFSQYKVGDLHVRGNQVTNEAAADLGGLILAYKAFHDLPEYKNSPVIEGFSPSQQFFLSFAHKLAANMTPEMARQQIYLESHPPSLYQVNGTLANLPQFQQTFSIPSNSPMVNPKRCVIW